MACRARGPYCGLLDISWISLNDFILLLSAKSFVAFEIPLLPTMRGEICDHPGLDDQFEL